jgi:hypothetical protein
MEYKLYKLLNAAQNEIRLLCLAQDIQYANSAQTAREHEYLLYFEMKTVSLDDWTAESRKFMDSTGSKTYSSEEYLKKEKDAMKNPNDRWAQEAALYQLLGFGR